MRGINCRTVFIMKIYSAFVNNFRITAGINGVGIIIVIKIYGAFIADGATAEIINRITVFDCFIFGADIDYGSGVVENIGGSVVENTVRVVAVNIYQARVDNLGDAAGINCRTGNRCIKVDFGVVGYFSVNKSIRYGFFADVYTVTVLHRRTFASYGNCGVFLIGDFRKIQKVRFGFLIIILSHMNGDAVIIF